MAESFFWCNECGRETPSVHIAEAHENRNPGHEMWEIEREAVDEPR